MRHGAGAAVAPANERHRLVGLQQRRGRDAGHLERLEVLSARDPVILWLRQQPLAAHKANVSATERLHEPIIQRREDAHVQTRSRATRQR